MRRSTLKGAVFLISSCDFQDNTTTAKCNASSTAARLAQWQKEVTSKAGFESMETYLGVKQHKTMVRSSSLLHCDTPLVCSQQSTSDVHFHPHSLPVPKESSGKQLGWLRATFPFSPALPMLS